MSTFERSSFIAHETSEYCAFPSLANLAPADADEGGLAKLLTTRGPNGETIAVKRFHGARELDPPLFEQHKSAAKAEFDRLVEIDGAMGHAPKAYAIGSCFDENGCEHPAIAMQFVEGFTLEYALKAGLITGSVRKADKTRSILQVGSHVAHALKACNGVVHRDLNPRNVMLQMSRRGAAEKAVLIDFGQAVASSNPLVTPSAEPHRLATISFGAPEVYGGPFYFMRNNDSVDVYSLGALLYYLRTRSIPFLQASSLDPTTTDGARAIVEAKREPVSIASELGSSLRSIDRRLDCIAADCTAFDPRDRPDIDEVVRRLEEALGSNAGDPSEEEADGVSTEGDRHPAASPRELLELADNYFYGHCGKIRDKSLSLQCLVKAAEAGDATAQLKLGRSLALGQHGIIDPARARFWLESAQSLGHPGAAATLRALSA